MNYKLFLKNYFPLAVRLLIGKALLLFILYQLITSLSFTTLKYHLTTNVGTYATKLINLMVSEPFFSSEIEYVNGQKTLSSQIYFKDLKVVYIGNSCNGFISFMRYIVLIILFPSTLWRKFLYVICGLLIIHLLNIARCAGLIYINLYHPEYFNFSHDYLFRWVIYGTIFVLWICFLRKVQFKNVLLPSKKPNAVQA